MNKYLIFLILSTWLTAQARAQTINAAYVKTLYEKYPTQKTDFCSSCKLWVNPFFKSIADTLTHTPVLTYYVYTKAHRLEQEALGLPRTGIYAGWHAAYGQPNEAKVYTAANRIIGKPRSAEMLVKGHCQAWILLAWSADGVILSNTYTFNAAMEFQGQNTGTEIATEEWCRKLTGYKGPEVTDSVKIWCGTFGGQQTYTQNDLTLAVPSHYFKIIQYRAPSSGELITRCYWMPNASSEKRSLLPERLIEHTALVEKLGFDPLFVFKE
jgi:hypothetical protein